MGLTSCRRVTIARMLARLGMPPPRGDAITPDGKTAYVANADSGTVTPISIATGKAGPAIRVGTDPEKIAITPDGRTVYVADLAQAR